MSSPIEATGCSQVDAEFQDAGTVTRASMKIPFFLKESASVARAVPTQTISAARGSFQRVPLKRSPFSQELHRRVHAGVKQHAIGAAESSIISGALVSGSRSQARQSGVNALVIVLDFCLRYCIVSVTPEHTRIDVAFHCSTFRFCMG